MKSKAFFILIIVAVLSFTIGWFLHSKMRRSYPAKEPQSIQGFIDTVSQADTVKSMDFSNTVSGRFILTGSNCAGFNFIDHDVVLWTNEIACTDPDSLKIRWLSDSIFMTRSTLQIDKNCPPTVDIYKVISFDGRHLILKDVWTGWNNFKDETLKFVKQPG